MSVSLKPSSSLGFNRPLTQLVRRTLSVTNNGDHPVAFKVKTTAPKLYCVRPNSGRIEPGSSVDVQVLLQPMKEEPPANAKCKDKFLVQSTVITPEKETMSLHDLWSNIDGEGSTVHQQKIRVVYLPPVGQELPEEDEGQREEGPSSFMADTTGQYDTVRQSPERPANGHAEQIFPAEPQAPLERAFSPAVGDYSAASEHIDEPAPVPVTVHRPITPITPPAPQLPSHLEEELRAQLAAAQLEIQRLRTLLESIPEPTVTEESSGLRRRHPMSDTATAVSDSGETDTGTVVETTVMQQPEGVPPQMVVGISLVVFILTYLFF